jgi:hypothetical protein
MYGLCEGQHENKSKYEDEENGRRKHVPIPLIISKEMMMMVILFNVSLPYISYFLLFECNLANPGSLTRGEQIRNSFFFQLF